MRSSAQPRITVLVPVFSPDPLFFPRAVNSILDQAIADVEVILLVAGRRTVQTTRISRDPRVRLVACARPSVAAQLNEGLRLAGGAYVARMDADDIASPRRLETQYRFLEATPEVDVVGSHIRIIDYTGRVVGNRRYPLTSTQILAAFPSYNPLAHPTVMFRRSTVQRAGGYSEGFGVAQDYELWSRLARSGCRFANLDEFLVDYRVHPYATKAKKLRATILATLLVKKIYWFPQMTLRERSRMLAEVIALGFPVSLVQWVFGRLHYSSRPF